MNRHRSHIRLNQNTAVGIHFNTASHNLSHLTVTPIKLIFNDGKIQRLNKEYYWQLRQGKIYPKGLNNYPVEDAKIGLTITHPLNQSTDIGNLNNLQALLNENQDKALQKLYCPVIQMYSTYLIKVYSTSHSTYLIKS